MSENNLPLSGITVIEVGSFIAAPFAAMQLADLGARVIKVENPGGGDLTRESGPFVGGESAPYLMLNRHKESVQLDLKSDEGREALQALARDADVVIENLRPGAMKRLGLGYEQLSASNPALIYASGSGWGADGPLAHLPGLDIMAQARSGLMSVTGHPGGAPARVGISVCDLVTALYIALAVTAALRERETSGHGQHIDVSLFETGVSLAVWEAAMFFTEGTVARANGSAHQTQAPYQAVEVADGYATIGANSPKNWAALCAALDREDLLEDPRYLDTYSRLQHRVELIEQIEQVTRTMTASALIERLEVAGVPCAPINTYDQVFTDPTLTARNFFWEADHPRLGKIPQLGSPMRFSRTPVRRDSAAPELGSSTDDVLAALREDVITHG